jgi:hypothetical protein
MSGWIARSPQVSHTVQTMIRTKLITRHLMTTGGAQSARDERHTERDAEDRADVVGTCRGVCRAGHNRMLASRPSAASTRQAAPFPGARQRIAGRLPVAAQSRR